MREKNFRSRLLICTSKILLGILAVASILCIDVKTYAAGHRLDIVVDENGPDTTTGFYYDGSLVSPSPSDYYFGPFDVYLTNTYSASITEEQRNNRYVRLFLRNGSSDILADTTLATLYSQYSSSSGTTVLLASDYGAGYKFLCNSVENLNYYDSKYYFLRGELIPCSIPISPTVDAPATVTPHEHNWVFKTIYEPTEEADGLEGECCECGAVRNTSAISAANFLLLNKYKQIENAQIGQNVVLDMKWMNSLSSAFMKRLAQKNSSSYTIRFIYDKKQYEVYIPQGAVYDTSLKYYGPEKLMEMFEYKQLN